MTHILKLHQNLIIIFLLLLGAVQLASGQVTGPPNVLANSTEDYYFDNGQSQYPVDNNTWTISGGTPISHSKSGSQYTVKVLWNGGLSNGTVVFNATSDYLYVFIGSTTPSNPPNPTVQSTAPGSVTLQRTGTPPGGITWYWQETSSGTSTLLGSGSTKTVTTGTSYYIRARNSSGTWSTGSGSVSFTVPPTYNFSDENYVHTTTPRVATTDISTLSNSDKIESISYFDGLGRPMQSIGIRAGGNSEDIVTHVDYDEFGRQDKEYLPFTATSNGGFYRTGALASTKTFYDATKYNADFPGMTTSNINPYSEKHLEASPLSRVLEQAAPGYDWKLNETADTDPNNDDADHTIKFEYDTNTATEVKIYQVTFTSTANNTYTPELSGGTSNYPAKKLYKTITKDENWTTGSYNTTEEFKDMQGRIILKRTYADADITNDGDTDDTGETQAAHDTYYVYDDYGNLTYVLPPKAEPHSAKPDATELSGLCYQYKYDHRNRLVEKKIPGKDWEYIVYDNLDRPVLTQDKLLRDDNKWLFTKYDALGRVAYTGIHTNTSQIGRVNMQNHFNSQNNTAAELYESRAASNVDYDNTNYYNANFPNTGLVIHTINYYDNYSFDGFTTMPSSINGQSVINYNNSTSTQKLTKGLTTGTKVRVLDSSPVKWITTQTGYDEKRRTIYIKSVNDYLSTTDIVKNTLDFTGAVTKTETSHDKGSTSIDTEDVFTYDHAGRLLKQTQELNNTNVLEVIAENSYDDLGQLISKGVGGKTTQGRLQTVDYTYNIRGWLKQINTPSYLGTDLFSFKINYNTNDHGGTNLFNGNISETEWKTANTDSNLKWYKYSYDALNRITSGVDNSTNQDYKLQSITYDLNGNITSLERRGHIVANPVAGTSSHFSTMDDLAYTYETKSNKLINVLDNGDDNYGFKDIENGGNDYIYNANGNLTYDLNKRITSIQYNHLNLPTKVRIKQSSDPFSPTDDITYTYDALGNKLRKKVNIQGQSHPADYYYAGNYVYNYANGNFHLNFFNHPEGYVDPNSSGGYDYVYQYKDHLGNVRLSYEGTSGNYENILNDSFANTTGDWATKDGSTFALDNGRLKVNVDGSWEGVTHDLGNITVSPGDEFKVRLDFDKGNTLSTIRVLIKEMDANGNYLSYVGLSWNQNSGSYEYNYTVNAANKLQLIIHKINTNTSTETQFYIDHISMTKGDLEILEENNYYPFGLKHKGYNTVVNNSNRALDWKYNGVEFEEALGLNLYEMDFRMYDPALGRFNGIDPVTHHSQGTSVAFDNNPVFWADPSGANATNTVMNIFNSGIEGTWYNTGNGAFSTTKPEDKGSEESEGCDDCSKCPETCPDNKKEENKTDSFLNYNWGGLGTNLDMAGIVTTELKVTATLSVIPIHDETGRVVGMWRTYNKVSFKALKYVNGVLKPVGGAVSLINFGVNTHQVATNKMSVGRYSFNTLGGAGSMYAASAYGGPIGVAVGGVVYVGDMFIQAGEVSAKQKKSALETSRFKVEGFNPFSLSDWKSLGRFVNPGSFFSGFSN